MFVRNNDIAFIINIKIVILALVFNIILVIIGRFNKTIGARIQTSNFNLTSNCRNFFGSSTSYQTSLFFHPYCRILGIVQPFQIKGYIVECFFFSSIFITNNALFINNYFASGGAVFRINNNIIKPFFQLICIPVIRFYAGHRNGNQERRYRLNNSLRPSCFNNQIQAQIQVCKLSTAIIFCKSFCSNLSILSALRQIFGLIAFNLASLILRKEIINYRHFIIVRGLFLSVVIGFQPRFIFHLINRETCAGKRTVVIRCVLFFTCRSSRLPIFCVKIFVNGNRAFFRGINYARGLLGGIHL